MTSQAMMVGFAVADDPPARRDQDEMFLFQSGRQAKCMRSTAGYCFVDILLNANVSTHGALTGEKLITVTAELDCLTSALMGPNRAI